MYDGGWLGGWAGGSAPRPIIISFFLSFSFVLWATPSNQFASDCPAARFVRNIFLPATVPQQGLSETFFANGRAAESLKAPSNLWLRIPYRRNGYPCVFQVQYVDAAILPMVLNPFSILPSEWFRKASLQDFNPKFTIVICVLYIAADIKFHATVFEDQ